MRQSCVIALLCCSICCYAAPEGISIPTIEGIKHSIVPIVCGYLDVHEKFQIAFVAGTGFFIDTDGRFITDAHVVDKDKWDARIKETHACIPAIYIPNNGWGKFQYDIAFQYYWFPNCDRDATVDLAVCKPIENPFASTRIPKGTIRAVSFDADEYPDGTPIAFTGFPLEIKSPITSIGFKAGTLGVTYDTTHFGFVIDKAVDKGAMMS